jgi:hypothetical protein
MRLGLPHHVEQRAPLWIGAGAVVVLVVAGIVAPAQVMHGWLVAFASVGGIPLGCLALLAIHALTGGRWGDAARPSLPLLLVLVLPLLAGAQLLYPWAADPAAAGPGVASLYLNTGLMALRSEIVLAVLAIVAVLAHRGPLAPLLAGLCLVVYAVGMNLSAFDWLLSLDPRFTSSDFGMQLIVQQLASALAFVILTTDAAPEETAWGDLAALLFATVLGETYLILMSYIVEWYGDLPEQAAYYLARSRHGWQLLALVGMLVGSVLPMLALLFGRVRHRPVLLRLVAVAVLFGVLAEDFWLIGSGAGAGSILAGLVACLAAGGLLLAFAARWPGAIRRWSVADGG